MKKAVIHIMIVSAMLSLSFVSMTNDKESLIMEALEKRIIDYEKELISNCREDAITEAEIKVDSIIAVELGAGPIDTINFPRKPVKPSFESFDSLDNNQIELKPLFEKKRGSNR